MLKIACLLSPVILPSFCNLLTFTNHVYYNVFGIFPLSFKGPVQFGLLCLKLYSGILNLAVGPRKFSQMNFLIFRYFWQKKNFFSTPLVGAALLGGGGNLHFGGLVTLDKNETFHSLCLCYPATFGEKKNSDSLFFLPKVAGQHKNKL